MFKTATKVLQAGSGLALFPRLECALASHQIEQVPGSAVLYLTWAGVSCQSCRAEPCECAFAALHLFSINCSLSQPADIPCFKSFFFFFFLSLHFGTRQAKDNLHWNWVCSVGTNYLFVLFKQRRCAEGTITEEQERATCKAWPFMCQLWPHCKIDT